MVGFKLTGCRTADFEARRPMTMAGPPIRFIPRQTRFVPPDGVLVACGFPSRPGLASAALAP